MFSSQGTIFLSQSNSNNISPVKNECNANYFQISLDSDSSQKFLELLVANLRMLSVLMEIGTLNEFSNIAEDILNYFRSTFSVDAPMSVHCVEQLLKCLFGTNLTVNISEISFKNNRNTGKVVITTIFKGGIAIIFRVLGLSSA